MSSIYCKIVFVLAFLLSYFLLPEGVFGGVHKYIAIIFMFSFSFSVSCIVRNIKEKIILARTYKTSVFSLILSVLGFSAFQVCGINAGMCTATVGMGVVSTIFPSFLVGFLSSYGHLIIWFSVILQILALYFMKCFNRGIYKCNE
jgi:hypothetical protein